jgi:NAD(P)-dependent dehydrogenase (short-subunit alcohol dehydrogenase family)
VSVVERQILVTGGSSGIGAEVVRRFRRLGDRVTILDRVAPTDSDVGFVQGDVTSVEDQERAVAVAAPDGLLDVLVANAGIHDGGRRLGAGDGAATLSVFRRVIEVNLLGYVLSIEAAASALRRARGSIVLTLSDASFDVRVNNAGAAYSASKHAGIGLLRVAARDLAPEVRVNAVAPGGVATHLSVEEESGVRRIITDPDALARRLAERTVLERGADIGEIAATYLYLASSDAGAITGQVIRVDGGLLS